MSTGASPREPPQYLFREDLGSRRKRPIFGALGLRPPRGDHSRAEAAVLAAAAAGASRVVEIGAFEGGGSAVIRASMLPGGTLTIVDPYPRGRFGFSTPLVSAKRLARRQRRVTTRWVRAPSLEAARGWERDLDAVVIDGVHTLQGVREDWASWGGFVRSGGALVARNDVIGGAGESGEQRSALLLAAAADGATWEVFRFADSFTAYRRL